MNIISSLVGIAVMGIAMPMVAQMTLQPHMAQKRAENFSIAESAAVTYAATNEGAFSLAAVPAGCETSDLGDNAYSISCTHGENQFIQTVTRSFRLALCDDNDGNNGHGNSGGYDCSNPGGYANNARVFDYASPKKFSGHQCPTYDTWGVNGYNDANSKAMGGACIPAILWTQATYQASNPDNWLYDVNNYNGWGNHVSY